MSKEFTGKCLCGSVTYVATGAPVVTAQCHCEECRRLSGTGHAVGAMFPRTAVELNGNLQTFSYQSAKGTTVTKAFCPTCGSPIFGTNSGSADHMTLALGIMDDARDLNIDVVIFARDKPAWDHPPKNTPKFDAQPDWAPAAKREPDAN